LGAIIASGLFGIITALIPFFFPDVLDRRWLAIVCWLVAGYHGISAVVYQPKHAKRGSGARSASFSIGAAHPTV
jgi:hypothetical protein